MPDTITESTHTKHTTVEAMAADCIAGECDHIDENGMPDDFSLCPSFDFEVCVDCMVEDGRTSDPAWWEGSLSPWPCEREPEPEPPAPPIFKKGL